MFPMKFSKSFIFLNWLSGVPVGVGVSDVVGKFPFEGTSSTRPVGRAHFGAARLVSSARREAVRCVAM